MNKWIEIFKRHHELMIEFESVEEKNGLLLHNSIPVDLNSKKGQASIRTTAWRITEEVCEAIQADYRLDRPAFREEVADILSFLIELMILCGITAEEVSESISGYRLSDMTVIESDKDNAWLDFILELGVTMNLLKNKPWSLRDRPLRATESFHKGMLRVFRRFIQAAKNNKISVEDLMESYIAKNLINHDRLLKDLPV